MLNKTKAALQGRQCHYIESKQSQTITLIDQINRSYYRSGADGALTRPTGYLYKYLDQFCAYTPKIFSQMGRKMSFSFFPHREVGCVHDLMKKMAISTPITIKAVFFIVYPFGSIPCLSNSRRASSFNQLPRLTPSRIAAWFSCSRNSGVIRIWKVGDSPSPFGVLSLLIVDMYVRNPIVWILLCTYVITVYVKIATPRECLQPLPRRLTKPLIEVTIMADTQSTQTRPKYHFRFLALDRANRKATPCCISVDASSECEARRVLAPYFILSLAARLPVYGESHQTASTVTEIEMVGGMVKMPTPSAIEKISTPSVCISEIETEVRNA
jgi:hypothetical protein